MDYNGTARSNYFKVKDVGAFKEWAVACNLRVADGTEDRVAILTQEGWPSQKELEDATYEELDIADDVASFLSDGEVAVLIEVGYEGTRYMVGVAQVVSSTGHVSVMDLNSWAMTAAQALAGPGVEVTGPEY